MSLAIGRSPATPFSTLHNAAWVGVYTLLENGSQLAIGQLCVQLEMPCQRLSIATPCSCTHSEEITMAHEQDEEDTAHLAPEAG